MANITHKVKIEGTEYTFQKLPVREAIKLRCRCRTKDEMDDLRFYEELLEHVVISPKLTVDSFEDVQDLEDLMREVIHFQYASKKKPSQQ